MNLPFPDIVLYVYVEMRVCTIVLVLSCKIDDLSYLYLSCYVMDGMPVSTCSASVYIVLYL